MKQSHVDIRVRRAIGRPESCDQLQVFGPEEALVKDRYMVVVAQCDGQACAAPSSCC
jgi:hypothetical protein